MAFTVTRMITPTTYGRNILSLPRQWCDRFKGRLRPVMLVAEDLIIIAPQGLEERALKLIKEDRDD